MKKIIPIIVILFIGSIAIGQEQDQREKSQGHYNLSKFRQLKQELPTPNSYRTASGAPGHEYYQQKADYKMDIILDDEQQRIYGEEVITYHNNSPDALEYLWIQLDQNVRAPNAMTNNIKSAGPANSYNPKKFTEEFLGKPFPGGFNIEFVKSSEGDDLNYTINNTMMRIDLPKTLKSKDKVSFKIKWWYNIPNHVTDGGRSGFEHFEDGNNNYVIAQFFPRMAVYNDIEGWQNLQFLGRGEFALAFGDYEVNITTPEDHILEGTGWITNRKEMLTSEQWKRYEKALNSFDKPVVIVSQEEAEENEKKVSKKTKTWKLKAENVRDFAFATSRKYILDGQAVKIGDRTVMAISVYSKEGNPLWEEYSTRVVASTLKSYSAQMFDYPYHKAISVHAKNQGMEYPMICFNHGRPKPDGSYTERVKNGMISVIVHEVGHNWFPMIINSDERQWGWMDEGLNSFAQILAEQDFEPGFPSRGYPKSVVDYMSGDQTRIAPIMTQHDNVFKSGPNAYFKPAAGLYILREVVLGNDLFDKAFKTYSERWKFKHPTPADFFRTMEDASGTDLDWFWRGWFYTTDYNDIGIKAIKKYQLIEAPTDKAKAHGASSNVLAQRLYLHEVDSHEKQNEEKAGSVQDNPVLKEYLLNKFTKAERASLKNTKYFYEVIFEKPGGLVMPILVEITYTDGTKENKYYPAEIWRFNDREAKKVWGTEKEIKEIKLDPNQLTSDVNPENNSWPRKENESKFDTFKKDKISN